MYVFMSNLSQEKKKRNVTTHNFKKYKNKMIQMEDLEDIAPEWPRFLLSSQSKREIQGIIFFLFLCPIRESTQIHAKR